MTMPGAGVFVFLMGVLLSGEAISYDRPRESSFARSQDLGAARPGESNIRGVARDSNDLSR
jgi:hypothetical protein